MTETPAPETPAPETPAPETPAPETPAPETPAPETPAPETPAKSLLDGATPISKEDIVYPEGFVAPPDAILDQVLGLASKGNMSKEDVNSLMKIGSDLVSHQNKIAQDSFNQLVSGYEVKIRADPEIGGVNFNKTIEDAKRARDHFGDNDFKELMKNPAIGNNPAVVRFLAKAGKMIGEGKPVSGSHSMIEDNLAARYPTMVKK